MILQKTNLLCLALLAVVVSCVEDPERRNMIYSDYTPLSATEVMIQSRVIETKPDFQLAVYGLCWSNSPGPTEKDGTVIGNEPLNSEGFQLSLSNLDRRKQYYVRAFITNTSGEIFYGNELVFVNDFLPELTNTRVSGYKEAGLKVTTTLNNTGTLPITEVGHVWATDPSPTIDDVKVALASVPSAGNDFESELTSMEKGTLYYVRSYAISGDFVTYGKQIVSELPDEVIYGTWDYVPMPELSQYFAITMSINDDLYFFGGYDRDVLDQYYQPSPLKKVYKLPYESIGSATAGITTVNDCPFAGGSHAFAAGTSAYFFSPGWTNMHEYNTVENTWITRPRLAGNVQFMTSDGVDGYAVVHTTETVGRFFKYTVATNTWAAFKSHDFYQIGLQKPLIIDKILYFVAGESSFYSLDLTSKTVTSLGGFPSTPDLLFEYNKNLYIICGNEVYHYNPVTTAWVKKSRAPIESLIPFSDDETFSIIPTYLRVKGETYISVFYPEYLWEMENEFSNLMIKYSE